MTALQSTVGAWVLVEAAVLVGLVREAVLLEDHVSSAQAWQ